jgi:hypothetical protein
MWCRVQEWWSYESSTYMSSWHGASLIEHRCKFTSAYAPASVNPNHGEVLGGSFTVLALTGLHPLAALSPGKQPPVSIGWEAGWTPEPVWSLWIGENSWPYRDSNSDPSFIQPVATPYTDSGIPTSKDFRAERKRSVLKMMEITESSFNFESELSHLQEPG